jgi:hypothetical protein
MIELHAPKVVLCAAITVQGAANDRQDGS